MIAFCITPRNGCIWPKPTLNAGGVSRTQSNIYDGTFFLLLAVNYFHKKASSNRSSRPEVWYKIDILKTFSKLTRKHLCRSLFFNKLQALAPVWYRCFPVSFTKFLKIPFSEAANGDVLLPTTNNHLVLKPTHLGQFGRTKWLWVQIPLL